MTRAQSWPHMAVSHLRITAASVLCSCVSVEQITQALLSALGSIISGMISSYLYDRFKDWKAKRNETRERRQITLDAARIVSGMSDTCSVQTATTSRSMSIAGVPPPSSQACVAACPSSPSPPHVDDGFSNARVGSKNAVN
jgi:hypothetical protein